MMNLAKFDTYIILLLIYYKKFVLHKFFQKNYIFFTKLIYLYIFINIFYLHKN